MRVMAVRATGSDALTASRSSASLSGLDGLSGNHLGLLLDLETGIRGLRLSGGAIFTEARLVQGRTGVAGAGDGQIGFALAAEEGHGGSASTYTQGATGRSVAGISDEVSEGVLFPTFSIGYDRVIAENLTLRAEAGGVLVSGFDLVDAPLPGRGSRGSLDRDQMALQSRPGDLSVHPFLTISIGFQF
jgi:hypothetical protein